MAHMLSGGLPNVTGVLMMQEHMNNVVAAEKNATAVMLPLTKLAYHWRMDIEKHYEDMTARTKNHRQDALADALGASRDIKKGYCRLPASFPTEPKTVVPDKWAEKDVSKQEFRQFLAEVSEIGESVFRNKIFVDRKRPGREYTEKLFRLFSSLERKKYEELYCSFGWYPESVTLRDRRAYIESLFIKKWGSANWEKAGDYLLLSPTTMDNIKARKNQHVSTAYHFIIALGDPEDAVQQLELYHWFEMHPILFERDDRVVCGGADGVAMLSMAVFDPLIQKMGDGDAANGGMEFWSTLRTMLIYYDNKFGLSLCGQLFYQDNGLLETMELPDGKG